MIKLGQAYSIAKKSILPDGAYFVGIYEHAHMWSFEYTCVNDHSEPVVGIGINVVLKEDGRVVSVGSGAIPQFFETNGYGKEVPLPKLKNVMDSEDYTLLVDYKKIYHDDEEDE